MDPRLSHELVSEMMQLYKPPVRNAVRTRPMVRQHNPEKRHATYFPSKASFDAKWNFSSDDESTWEFSAPVAHIARSLSTDTCSSTSSTPAQEIAMRYRAGLPLQAVLTGSSSTSSSSEDSDASWQTAPLDDESVTSEQVSPVADKNEPKAIHRQSRCDALLDALEEAMHAMKKAGRGENDRLVCHRPGCRDIVRDVRALMYHLHIHNIHDQSLTCPSCGRHFDGSFQMGSHRCLTQGPYSHLRSPPVSPIKEGFFRVLGKVPRLPHS
ncbi:hypothetical protein LshimejAT787_0805730 [Lyophyllum shimeji]|uniref:Uncharacterized protein n=1 Tax=Lyophyllum shimeji TaxID=47721 RepID=A0A9P3PQB7_LYOSH|nr:hypothetical protein LshimejAT787_0805730 [Lyophyllum shimeji]